MKIHISQFKKNILLLGIVSTFSACGIVPIAENQPSDDDIFFEEKAKVEVSTPSSSVPETIEIVEPVAEKEPEKPRPTFNTSRGYWLAAVEYLQNGEVGDAEWALEQALILKPGSKIAKNLIDQIESDPREVLGSEYFEYSIQNGDSLSKLAKQYLNDPLQFYILAKYNDIDNPSRLIIGKTIKIPGKKPVQDDMSKSTVVDNASQFELNSGEIDVEMESADSVEISSEENARTLIQRGEYDEVISLLENHEELNESDASVDQLLVESYYLKAQDLLVSKEKSEAKKLLIKAAALEPDNVKVNMALIDMDESAEARLLTEQSIKALAANSPIEAYELVTRALTIQPDFPPALEKQKQIKQQLISYYYKNALMAQRRQELDKAVEYWDEVLALDESNENAKLYRAKSIALQAKMKKFASAL